LCDISRSNLEDAENGFDVVVTTTYEVLDKTIILFGVQWCGHGNLLLGGSSENCNNRPASLT
jgi:hypothetical protein